MSDIVKNNIVDFIHEKTIQYFEKNNKTVDEDFIKYTINYIIDKELPGETNEVINNTIPLYLEHLDQEGLFLDIINHDVDEDDENLLEKVRDLKDNTEFIFSNTLVLLQLIAEVVNQYENDEIDDKL